MWRQEWFGGSPGSLRVRQLNHKWRSWNLLRYGEIGDPRWETPRTEQCNGCWQIKKRGCSGWLMAYQHQDWSFAVLIEGHILLCNYISWWVRMMNDVWHLHANLEHVLFPKSWVVESSERSNASAEVERTHIDMQSFADLQVSNRKKMREHVWALMDEDFTLGTIFCSLQASLQLGILEGRNRRNRAWDFAFWSHSWAWCNLEESSWNILIFGNLWHRNQRCRSWKNLEVKNIHAVQDAPPVDTPPSHKQLGYCLIAANSC